MKIKYPRYEITTFGTYSKLLAFMWHANIVPSNACIYFVSACVCVCLCVNILGSWDTTKPTVCVCVCNWCRMLNSVGECIGDVVILMLLCWNHSLTGYSTGLVNWIGTTRKRVTVSITYYGQRFYSMHVNVNYPKTRSHTNKSQRFDQYALYDAAEKLDNWIYRLMKWTRVIDGETEMGSESIHAITKEVHDE